MKAVDAATMRAIDTSAVKRFGMRSVQLMENGGRGVAEVVLAELGAMPTFSSLRRGRRPRVTIVAGKGNNGGDGFVAARHLKNAGVDVTLLLLAGFDTLKGDAKVNATVWKQMGGAFECVTSGRSLKSFASMLRHSAIVVDAMLGTGISVPVRGLYRAAIELVNSAASRVVAVDVPTGIDATNGAILGVAVEADVTATMAAVKTGLLTYPARDCAGRIEVVDIGLPAALIEDPGIRWNITEAADVRRVLVPRAANSHKGSFGHLLLVAGSPGKSGAAFLSATAAMRAGAGLATLALPESLGPVMEVKSTEVMTVALPESEEGTLTAASYDALAGEFKGKGAVVVGPGLGTAPGARALVELIVENSTVPVLLDADGLNVMGEECGVLKRAGAGLVITPHPGEAARLLGTTVALVQADRVGAAGRLAVLTGGVVLLKGACSVIAAPDGSIYFNTTGNAGLATAGTGDVLAGMAGAFLAGGNSPLVSAFSAAYLHGRAADRIKERVGEGGMTATDIIDELPGVLNSLSVGG